MYKLKWTVMKAKMKVVGSAYLNKKRAIKQKLIWNLVAVISAAVLVLLIFSLRNEGQSLELGAMIKIPFLYLSLLAIVLGLMTEASIKYRGDNRILIEFSILYGLFIISLLAGIHSMSGHEQWMVVITLLLYTMTRLISHSYANLKKL